MTNTPLEQGIEIDALESAEYASMARLLGEAFSLYDPPAVALGLSAEEIERLVGAFEVKALTENLSVVARDPKGDLLGAVLAEDSATDPPDGLPDLAPTFAPIGAMLEELDKQYISSRSVVPGTHLHVFMIGVDRRAGGRGLAHRLVQTCLDRARARGYQTAVTEATNGVSQHIFRKLGFVEVLSADYASFLFNSELVFSSIVGSTATILMERELSRRVA